MYIMPTCCVHMPTSSHSPSGSIPWGYCPKGGRHNSMANNAQKNLDYLQNGFVQKVCNAKSAASKRTLKVYCSRMPPPERRTNWVPHALKG
jgi:hypothetical protein